MDEDLKLYIPLGVKPEAELFTHGAPATLALLGALGAALLALQAGVPVIPVYSAGNYQPFQRLQLRFGAPIVLTQRPNAAGVQEATQCLQEAMERLQEELCLEMKPKYRTRAAEFHRRFRLLACGLLHF